MDTVYPYGYMYINFSLYLLSWRFQDDISLRALPGMA